MRKSLEQLIQRTICLKYSLPNGAIEQSNISTQKDDCYYVTDDSNLASILYNSLIDYAFNEYDISEDNHEKLLIKALKTRFKFRDDPKTFQQLGFYGEVLLYVMLFHFYNANAAITRGYFYHILEKSETKGYDAYHFIDNNGMLELWFGEAKFYQNMNDGIKSILEKLHIALSDDYLQENIIALSEHKNDFNVKGSSLEEIVKAWDENPNIIIIDELKKYKAKLIYPMFVIANGNSNYDNTIKDAIKTIKEYDFPKIEMEIDFSLFFILLPVNDSKKIKEEVINWIISKKPLI